MDVTVDSYKNLGALAFGIFWFATTVIVVLLKQERKKSISEHAASAKEIALFFGGISLVSSILLCVFFVKWFTPTFQLGPIFNAMVISSLALYAVAGVVPDIKGIQHKIHVKAAMTASALLLHKSIIVSYK